MLEDDVSDHENEGEQEVDEEEVEEEARDEDDEEGEDEDEDDQDEDEEEELLAVLTSRRGQLVGEPGGAVSANGRLLWLAAAGCVPGPGARVHEGH